MRSLPLMFTFLIGVGCAKPAPKPASDPSSIYFDAATFDASMKTSEAALASLDAIESTRENICRVMAQAIRMGAAVWLTQHESECPTADQIAIDNLVSDGVTVTDPWDAPFVIECAEKGPIVRSAGRDGVHGTKDDVVVGE